jgi:hypothetical protein
METRHDKTWNSYRFEPCPGHKILIHFNMNKVFLILLLSFILLSCGDNKHYINKNKNVDSLLIDTPVSDDEARDYLNDTIK